MHYRNVKLIFCSLFSLNFLSFTWTFGLCHKRCKERSDESEVKTFCSKQKFTMEENCCLNSNKTIIYGLDLRNCNIETLDFDLFHETDQNQTSLFLYNHTIVLDLSNNSLTVSNSSSKTWLGFVSLNKILLPYPAIQVCPGGDEFWQNSIVTNDTLTCIGQVLPCNVTAFQCPDHSQCTNNGPGKVTCECMAGFYGYKCWKTGKFPFVMYFGILVSSCLATTFVLWWVGRRLITKHAKTN